MTVSTYLAAVHPDAATVHQWRQHRRPAAGTLPHAEDVDIEFAESFGELVEAQIRRDHVIIVEQEHELGRNRINSHVAADSDANIDLSRMNDFALRCGLGIRW